MRILNFVLVHAIYSSRNKNEIEKRRVAGLSIRMKFTELIEHLEFVSWKMANAVRARVEKKMPHFHDLDYREWVCEVRVRRAISMVSTALISFTQDKSHASPYITVAIFEFLWTILLVFTIFFRLVHRFFQAHTCPFHPDSVCYVHVEFFPQKSIIFQNVIIKLMWMSVKNCERWRSDGTQFISLQYGFVLFKYFSFLF